ncbi:WD repeat-containing protein 18 [Cephus cinctus]|uniref:WD repeat-containing protein 18 n=1 Tax=Cephus cinctus TaxID=211228 RepID=A0AAJ7C9H1_CEPCN|nr:WD repeat-containing protein 18 [Cephus cinctus]
MQTTKEVIVTSNNSDESTNAAVWDPCTGSLLSSYRNGGPVGYHTLQILNGSYILAADSTKPKLYMWPLNSQTPVSNIRLTTPGKVSALSCTPNGLYIVAAISEKLFIWQTNSGRLLTTLARHYQTITCLKFTQDGSTFATGGEDGLVFIWSLSKVINHKEQQSPSHSFAEHTLPVKDLHFGQFGPHSRLISVSLDRTARIYNSVSGILLLTLIFDVPLTSVTTDLKETQLLVGCSNGTIIKINLYDPPRGTDHYVDTEKNNSAIFRGHESNVVALSVSNDCRTLLSGSTDGALHLWDIPSRQITKTIQHKGPITTAFFTKAFVNFRAQDLHQKILVKSLQRISDDSSKDDFIEIVSSHNDSHLLDYEAFIGNENHSMELNNDNFNDSLIDARVEMERLRKINASMYRYAAEYLLNK